MDLTRYLFQSGHYSALNRRAKPSGFDPGPRGTLSVADVEGLFEDARWDLGRIVAELQGRPVLARADFTHAILEDLPLTFVRDDHPFVRHGNIEGWPTDPGDEARLRRKELSTVLAARSILCLPGADPT